MIDLAFVFVATLLSIQGCDTNKESRNPLGPNLKTTTSPSDGTVPSLARYQTIYTSCGTFYLDYPSDFVGPPPPGHGRIGSTAQQLCSASIPGDGDGTVVPQKAGDPSADEGPKH